MPKQDEATSNILTEEKLETLTDRNIVKFPTSTTAPEEEEKLEQLTNMQSLTDVLNEIWVEENVGNEILFSTKGLIILR